MTQLHTGLFTITIMTQLSDSEPGPSPLTQISLVSSTLILPSHTQLPQPQIAFGCSVTDISMKLSKLLMQKQIDQIALQHFLYSH